MTTHLATEFSTESVAPAHRLGYWRDKVCATFAEIECASLSPAPFRARLSDVELAGTHFCEASATPVEVTKTPALVRHASHHNFMLCIQQSGACDIEQNGQVARLLPGDLALLDSVRPYRVRFPDGFRQLVVHMPRDALLGVARSAESRCGSRIPGDTGSSRLVSRFMQDISTHLRSAEGAGHPPAAEALKEAALTLIGAALAGDTTPGPVGSAFLASPATTESGSLLERARQLMTRELGDAELTVERIARRLAVSERRLQQVFQQGGESASHCLWRLRLEACKAALDRPEQAHRAIGEIAFMAGFSSFSHFSRAFKNAYGCTPREFRARHGG